MSITIGDAILWLKGDSSHLDRDLKSAEQKAQGFVSSVGAVVKNGLSTAIGFIAHDLISGAVTGLRDLALEAVDSVAGFERMQMSIESLVASELMRGKVATQTSQVVQRLTEAEKQKLDELIAHQKIADANVLQLQARFDAEHKAVIESGGQWSAKLTELEGKITLAKIKAGEYASQIEGLQGQEGQLVTVTKEVITGQMSMSEALAQAGPKAAALLEWIKQLAIHSPFDRLGILKALQTAMTYGFVQEQAQELTKTLVDFTAATGKESYVIDQASYALGQMRAAGKVLMQDLRQLMNAGIDVDSVLGKMGFSLADVGEKFIDSDKFIDTLITTLDERFGGAAERMTNSFGGLLSTLKEVQPDLLRAFSTPILEKFREPLSRIIEMLGSDRLRGLLDLLGKGVAALLPTSGDLDSVLDNISETIRRFTTYISTGFSPLYAFRQTLWSLVPQDLKDRLKGLNDQITPFIDAAGKLFTALANNDPQAFFAALDELGRAIGEFLNENAQGILEQFLDALFQPGWFPATVASLIWPDTKTGLDQFYSNLRTWIVEKAINLPSELDPWGIAFTNWLIPKIPVAIANNETFWLANREWIGSKVVELASGFFEWGTKAVNWITERTPEAMGNMGTFLGQLVAWIFAEGVPGLILATQEMSKALLEWIVNDAIPNVGPKLLEFKTAIDVFFQTVLIPGLLEFGKNFISSLIQGMTEREPEMKIKWEKIQANIKAAIEAFFPTLVTLGAGLMDHMASGILQRLDHVLKTVKGVIKDAIDSAGQALGEYNPFGGGGGKAGPEKRHSGGPIEAGVPYIVKKNEALIFPPMDGFVLPEVPDLSGAMATATAGGRAGGTSEAAQQELALEIDGMAVGRLILPGVLAELDRQGLMVVPKD